MFWYWLDWQIDASCDPYWNTETEFYLIHSPNYPEQEDKEKIDGRYKEVAKWQGGMQ